MLLTNAAKQRIKLRIDGFKIIGTVLLIRLNRL